jgi:hypothetical protein
VKRQLVAVWRGPGRHGVERRGEVPASERSTCSGVSEGDPSPSPAAFRDPLLCLSPVVPLVRRPETGRTLLVAAAWSEVSLEPVAERPTTAEPSLSGALIGTVAPLPRRRRMAVPVIALVRSSNRSQIGAADHPPPATVDGSPLPGQRTRPGAEPDLVLTPLVAGGRPCPSYRLNRSRESQSGRALDLLRGAVLGGRRPPALVLTENG